MSAAVETRPPLTATYCLSPHERSPHPQNVFERYDTTRTNLNVTILPVPPSPALFAAHWKGQPPRLGQPRIFRISVCLRQSGGG